ncbi:pyridoxamine 5'-phosphate oxidase family protein [Lysobacter korlensis]|uniref:Pyridoxamine 5'-phosphate oxidase family protein n=1 Tax=Lysobacter korlensis TaxID=553636 RepID=A0ABV6RTA7_9GAMM
MSSWAEIARDAPDFARRLRAVFDAGTNKTIATLRADGSPRISGTELVIEDERVLLGAMPDSRKLADLLRDPRVAIHSPTLEPPDDVRAWAGDGKLSGTAVTVSPREGMPGGAYFELDITEAVLTSIAPSGSELRIESWHPGRGYRERLRT